MEETADLLRVSKTRVLEIFPTFGPEDDRSVLRDDLNKFLKETAL